MAVKAKPARTAKLKFAALIRVSTEKQAERGESLRIQKEQIETAVQQLGGVITRSYDGQEHATPGYEREMFNRLLADVAKPTKPFDAVMVINPSRWSRDQVESERGLRHLYANDIRFFVLNHEFDLGNDQARLMLSLETVLNSHTAQVGVTNSLLARIVRAKRGRPTSSPLKKSG